MTSEDSVPINGNLAGQVAFVTGAGSGIGKAVACALAERGADVGFLTRSGDRAASVGAEIEGLGRRVVAVVGDVGRWTTVKNAVSRTVSRLGRPTMVVANAGMELTGTVLETSPADWSRLVATNLSGVFYTCKAATPALIQAGGGSIVVIGSDASLMGSRGYAAYNTTKHGLVGLTKCMALDFGPQGIRTNIVCPSFVETEMMYRVLEPGGVEYARQLRRVPLGRFGRVEDVTQVVLHLLSPAASFTNGAVYQLDGGSTLTAARSG